MVRTDVSEVMANLDRLGEAVGDGVLELEVVMDQRYARYQHERTDLHHPGGGGPHFLTRPLYEGANDMLQALADAAVTPGGSRLESEAETQVERWVTRSVPMTPKWMGDLPNSHAPSVRSAGRVVYARPPKARRLTDEEIRLKNRYNVHPSRRNRRGRR